MSQLSSANILITSALPRSRQGSVTSNMANSAVLELLMPQLIDRQKPAAKAQHSLENIDCYMLEETELLLTRLSGFCLQLGMAEGANFDLILSKGQLKVSTYFEQAIALEKCLLQDPWITGAFKWLEPNYRALADSQELLSFAQAYEKNRQQALVEYSHLEHGAMAMHCYVRGCIEQGKATLSWFVESPVTNYQVNNI